MRNAWLAAIGLACATGAMVSSAQTLQMADPPAARPAVATPARGTSMAEVEARYGAPSQRFDAIGQPPITRWVYPSFVVYFEHSHVVHAVALRPTAGTP
jgi:hypothetical protein